MRDLSRSGKKMSLCSTNACISSRTNSLMLSLKVTCFLRKIQSSGSIRTGLSKSNTTLAMSFKKCSRTQLPHKGAVLTMRNISARYAFGNSWATSSFFYQDVNITFAMNASDKWLTSTSRMERSIKFVALKAPARSN
jgi:hypothetical protein